MADRQGAAPHGCGVAAEETEEGTSVEAVVGKVPDLPWGGVDRRSPGRTGPCGDWGQPWECILIWARTDLLQITW